MKLQSKILYLVLGVVGGVQVLATAISATHSWTQLTREEFRFHEILLSNNQRSFGLYVWNFDTKGAVAGIDGLFKSPSVRRVQILDGSGKLFSGSTLISPQSEQDFKERTEMTGEVIASEDLLQTLQTHRKKSEDSGEVPAILESATSETSIVRVVSPVIYSSGGADKVIGHVVLDFSTELVRARIRQMILSQLAIGLLMTGALVGIIFFAIRKSVVTPVQKLMSASQEIAQGNFSREVISESDDEIGTLAENFNDMRLRVKEFTENLQEMVDKRTQEVLTGKQKIQQILVHIEQGILTFDKDLRIEDEFSSFLPRFFSVETKAIPGQQVTEFIFKKSLIGSDQYGLLVATLGSFMGENVLSFEVNEENLPKELQLKLDGKDRIVGLDWTPIVDSNDQVQRCLLSIRDMTERKILEEKIRLTQENNLRIFTHISEILSVDREWAVRALKSANQTLQDIFPLIQNKSGDPHAIFRELHTMKGTFRTLQLKGALDATHTAETAIAQWRAKSMISGTELALPIKELQKKITEYNETVAQVFALNSEKPSFLQSIDPPLRSFINTLKGAGCQYDGLVIQDSVGSWRPEMIDVLNDILVHAFSNSADHGFVIPKQRGLTVSPAKLVLKLSRQGNRFEVEFSDNGAGIDAQLVQKKAAALGIPFAPERLAEILLTDGFSTAEKVTQSSGRGVGLKAIRSIANDRKGNLSLYQRPEGGLTIKVELSLNFSGEIDHSNHQLRAA